MYLLLKIIMAHKSCLFHNNIIKNTYTCFPRPSAKQSHVPVSLVHQPQKIYMFHQTTHRQKCIWFHKTFAINHISFTRPSIKKKPVSKDHQHKNIPISLDHLKENVNISQDYHQGHHHKNVPVSQDHHKENIPIQKTITSATNMYLFHKTIAMNSTCFTKSSAKYISVSQDHYYKTYLFYKTISKFNRLWTRSQTFSQF